LILIQKHWFSLRVVCGFFLLSFLLGGCAQNQPAKVTEPLVRHSSVHGGQQPVSGSTVVLYAVGTTGDGSPATSLMTNAVTSDANGNFNLAGAFSCPSPSALVYITATGGNPGLSPGTNNAALTLMAALGPCINIGASTVININELTTVAAVWSLAPFMSSYSSIGSGTTDASALASAFTLASEYVNTTTGTSPGLNVPAGTTVPVAQFNTLADILSSCVNSAGGVAGDGSACGTLFSAATPIGGTAPVEVTDAGLNIANNPTANVSSLYGLVTATAPFQPMLSVVPAAWTVGLTLPSTLSVSPSALTFPSTILSINSFPQTVTLTNTGSSAIPLYALTISGTNSGDFSQINNCSPSLSAATSCTVQVTFTPSAAGERAAYLNIADGSPNPIQSVALMGTTTINEGSTAGPASFSPSSLTFLQLGMPQQVTFSNFGLTPLTIQSLNLSSGYSQTNNCGSAVNAQSTCTINISLIDPSVGPTAALVIFDNAVNGLQTLPLNIASNNGTTSPALSFGAVDVGVTSASQSFQTLVKNTLFSGSITGPNAADFSFVGASACLSGSIGCSINIAFTPTAAGYRTATLSTNLGDVVALNGVGNPGGPAAFLLSPPIVTLTSQSPQTGIFLGSESAVTVTNVGGTVLDLFAAVGGLNPDAFLFSPGLSADCGTSLAPGATCQLSINFAATGTIVGTRTATFTVTDTVSGLQHSVHLTGTGVYPTPRVTGSLAWFYDTQVGSQSVSQTATATAPDGHALTIQIVQGANIFQILSPTYCPGGTSCPITAVFHPASTDSVNGTVLITDTITGLTTTLDLLGAGGLATFTLSSQTFPFAARDVGSTSTLQTATLTITGNGPVTITGITVAGTNPGDFQETDTCHLTNTFFPTQSCSISVSFMPTAAGPRTAYVQIVSSAVSSPDTLQLTGTGN
jgi:trimeric autotransporter adhesin